MGLIFFWRTVFDAGTITANSTTAGFPVSNLKDPTLSQSESWQSDGSESTDMITMDLLEVRDITSLFVGGHDLKSTDTLTLRYASDSGFTTDTGTITPTFYEDFLIHFFDLVQRRYWRLEILKSVGSETRRISRIMIGDHTEFTRSLALNYPVGVGGTTSRRVVTEGGQMHSTIGTSIGAMRGNLIVDGTEKAEIEALKRTFQNAFPFVAAIDYDNHPITKTLYGYLTSFNPPPDIAIDHWTYGLEITEQK